MATYLKENQNPVFFDNFTEGSFTTSSMFKPPGSLHGRWSLKAGSYGWPTLDEHEMVKILVQTLWLESNLKACQKQNSLALGIWDLHLCYRWDFTDWKLRKRCELQAISSRGNWNYTDPGNLLAQIFNNFSTIQFLSVQGFCLETLHLCCS